MSFSPGDFFAYRTAYSLPGDEGLALMEGWLGLETCWRSALLEQVRVEAIKRLSSGDSAERRLSLQALAFVGEKPDLDLLLPCETDDSDLAETRGLARAQLIRELTPDEEFASAVRDRSTFLAFLQKVMRHRRRADRLIEAGFNPRELRDGDRWGINSISLFLDNASFAEAGDDGDRGPTWSDLAQAILRGRDYQ